MPWRDWSSDVSATGSGRTATGNGDAERVRAQRPGGSQPCTETVVLAPDATVDDVVGRLSDLPQFTVVDGPTVVSAFGREAVHLRIRADSLWCEPPADQYNLAEIFGGDGGDSTAYLGDGGDSTSTSGTRWSSTSGCSTSRARTSSWRRGEKAVRRPPRPRSSTRSSSPCGSCRRADRASDAELVALGVTHDDPVVPRSAWSSTRVAPRPSSRATSAATRSRCTSTPRRARLRRGGRRARGS